MEKRTPLTAALPVVAMRGVVIFPGMTLHFDVGRKKSVAALKTALNGDRNIFLVAQRDMSEEEPAFTNLCPVGVVAEIRQLMRVPNTDTVRVVAEGKYRAVITEPLPEMRFLYAMTQEKHEQGISERSREYADALMRGVQDIFDDYANVCANLAPDILIAVKNEKNPGALADYIAGNVSLPFENKQRLLSLLSPVRRLEELSVMLADETELLMLEADIQAQVQERMDKNQREYYLREQLKVISGELNEDDSPVSDAEKYRDIIRLLNMPESSKERLYEECDRLVRVSAGSPESYVTRTYLERCIKLPWGVVTKDNADINHARKVLDRDHYGLNEVKDRIIEYIGVRKLVPDIRSQIICLVGPPGVGKTSIAKSLAAALGRNYVRVSLGGVHDEAEIRGHRKTYIGSMPGRIITALEQAKSSNPLMLLDEIDKLGNDYKGDPMSALLEVLDGEQNFAFCDHYIEIPFDLSRVMFVLTANDLSDVPAPLRDRMEIIELYSYTAEEKFNIAKKHLFPKQMKLHGLTKSMLSLKDDALRAVIDGYTREAGVRTLERTLAKLCRKAAVHFASGETDKLTLTVSSLRDYLGAVKYKPEQLDKMNMHGAANGLAWTSVGGEIMQIEAAVFPGTGKLELTGSLGDVMKESGKAAVSYIRANAAQLDVDADFYKNRDIHIHVPEGAVPKDGPSAGVTLVTALVSALTGRAVDAYTTMTGEITLRGRVLAIGGLREKTMAAYKAGMKRVIIPEENVSDLDKVDSVVKSSVEFLPVSDISSVLDAVIKKEQQPSVRKDACVCTESGASAYVN